MSWYTLPIPTCPHPPAHTHPPTPTRPYRPAHSYGTPSADAYGTPSGSYTPSQGGGYTWYSPGIYVTSSGGQQGVIARVDPDTCVVRQNNGEEVTISKCVSPYTTFHPSLAHDTPPISRTQRSTHLSHTTLHLSLIFTYPVLNATPSRAGCHPTTCGANSPCGVTRPCIALQV
jgi:hypothetical protein